MSLNIPASVVGRDYVPALSYALMTAPVARHQPNSAALAAGAEVVPLLTLEDRTPAGRGQFVVSLLSGLDWEQAEYGERLGALLSGLEAVFPGIVARLAVPGLTTSGNVLSDDAYEAITQGTIQGNAITQAQRDEPGALMPGFDNATLPVVGTCRLVEAAAIIGLLIYTIVKTPTTVNEAAFLTNRPRGAAGAVGATALPWIPPSQVYRAAGSTWTLYPALRTRLCRMLVTWVGSAEATPNMSAVICQVRLWRDHGLAGLKLARAVMIAAGGPLSAIPGLRPAVEAFEEHWRVYEAAAGQPDRDYENAIMGPLSALTARRSYTPLVIIGRVYERHLNGQASMSNFAATRAVAYAHTLNTTTTDIAQF